MSLLAGMLVRKGGVSAEILWGMCLWGPEVGKRALLPQAVQRFSAAYARMKYKDSICLSFGCTVTGNPRQATNYTHRLSSRCMKRKLSWHCNKAAQVCQSVSNW